MPYKFNIVYRAGSLNAPADALSRSEINKAGSKKTKKGITTSGIISEYSRLARAHREFGHPGINRLWDLVKSLGIAVSLDDVKKICNECSICSQLKPNFQNMDDNHLISALNPLDRLSIDFKGILPTTKHNYKYLLIAVDEYSRFPFAFPCRDTSTNSVIDCLKKIFSVFGIPRFIHSDRGSSFVSLELKEFLFKLGISTSNSTPYNPRGNSQCERYVGTIWKTVQLLTAERGLTNSQWDEVVDEALACIRSLKNTSTNCSPHARMFNFTRNIKVSRLSSESLNDQSDAYLRRFVRSKNEPIVEKVRIVNRNPNFTEVQLDSGKIEKYSNRNIASCPNDNSVIENVDDLNVVKNELSSPNESCNPLTDSNFDSMSIEDEESDDVAELASSLDSPVVLRKSSRTRQAPVRYSP